MARPRNTSVPKVHLKPDALPDWAKKMKEYRENAGFTQVDLEKAMNAPANTLSLVERGKRLITTVDRTKFFELIGQHEDLEIPVRIVKEAKAKRPAVPKQIKASKPSKPASLKGPARASTGRKPNAKVEPVTPQVPEAALPSPSSPGPTEVVAPERAVAPPAVERVQDAPKTASRARAQKSMETQGTPTTPASPSGLSPVKDAVLRDIARILGNPGLSDSQARNLHGLFTSLAVNALLGG